MFTFVVLAALACWWSERDSAILFAQAKADAKADARTTPFTAVVRAHFSAWDTDKNGRLTLNEVDAMFTNPRIKGDEAAAVAVIKYLARNYIDGQIDKGAKDPTAGLPPFTLEQLDAYEGKSAKAAKKGKLLKYDQWFAAYQQRIKNTPRDLFPDGLPKLEAVVQGDLGDCYFINMVGAMVHRHPKKVCAMIRPEGKRFAVQFADKAKPVLIMPPTDAEIALNSTAEKNGLWLTVIEKAYGAHERKKLPKEERSKDAIDAAAYGGSAYDAIATLTNHDTIWVKWSDPNLHGELAKAVGQGCLICTTVRNKDAPPPLHTGHVYAVIGYDVGARLVTVFAGAQTEHTPKGNASYENGYEVKAGVLKVPLGDYVKIFTGISHEVISAKKK
jgi:hypothetical protein